LENLFFWKKKGGSLIEFFAIKKKKKRQSGHDPQKDFAKFGYSLNMEVKFLNILHISFWYLLGKWNHVVERKKEIWRYFYQKNSNFMAIENLKKHLF
jgi:hypothetical protein